MTWDDEDDAPSTRVGTSVRRIPFLPVLLIAFGAAALFHEMFGRGISVFPLAIGLFLIARSRTSGSYPLLVIGAVMAGSGAGDLMGDLVNSGAREALGSFGTAAGFFWLANIDRGRSNWAVIPAAIIGLIGLGELGFHMNELVNGGTGGWLLPAGVVVAGIMLLSAHRMPGPLRLAGLVFVGAAALSLVTNQSGSDGRRDQSQKVITTAPSVLAVLPDLEDKTVVLETVNGPVTVDEGDGTVSGATVSDDGDRVVITPKSPNGSVHLKVPAGTRLDLKTTNGPIRVASPVSDLVAKTVNGPISVVVLGDPDIVAASNGSITVDGGDEDGAYAHNGTTPGLVKVTTENGPIALTLKQLAGRS